MKKKVPVLNSMEKTRDSHFLKNYTLNYTNTAGNEKIYEMVSYFDHESADQIGSRATGVVIVGYHEDKMLLCKEFRMGVNAFIYNLPAGHIDEGETVLECARRELYEETGLTIVEFIDILPPSFASPDMSDSSAWLVMARVEGELGDYSEENEWIQPAFYSREQVAQMLKEETFSGRSQVAAWFFAHGR